MIRIAKDSPDRAALEGYGTVPIAFTVNTRLVVCPANYGMGGLLLVEEPVATPYIKDYDALDGEGPTRWQEQFDLTHWGFFAAFDGDERVGGAVVAWDTPGVDMLEGRSDLAVLWDLRVRPDRRGRGIGHLLFAAAEEWARARGCHEINIETQNVNVPASRFYAKQGCELKAIRRGVYRELPDEVQLLWCKPL